MSLASSSAVMAVGTIASRALGFVRSAVIAAAIGTQVIGDSFTVANTVPNMVYLLLVGGVINAVFVPQLVRAAKDPDGGKAYTDRLLTLTGGSLVVLTVVAVLAAPVLVALPWTGSEAGQDLAVLFAYWCLPQIFFYGVYTVLGQVLNARGVFGPMMWAPIANNVIAIAAGLLLLPAALDPEDTLSLSEGQAVFLAAGSTLGVVAQALVLVPYLREAGYRFTPRADFRGYGLGRAAALAKWTIGFVLVNQAAYFVILAVTTGANDRLDVAPGGSPGVGINAYSNAYLFFMLPHSVITVSLVTALLPGMSEAAVGGRMLRIHVQLSEALRTVGVGIVPAALGLFLYGPELGRVLFANGETTSEDATAIGQLVTAFSVGLVPFALHHVLLRVFYAYEDTRTPFRIACAIAACNAVLAVLAGLVLPARWVTLGVALGYSATYWLALVITARTVRGRVMTLDGERVAKTYARLVLAGLVGVAVAVAVGRLLETVVSDAGRAGGLLHIVVGGTALLGAYAWACALLGVRELREIVRAVRP